MRFPLLFLLMTMFAWQAHAEGKGWRSAKMILGVAGCAAQAVDLYTSRQAVLRPGNYEANPIFRSSNGGIRWRVAVPVKAAACALPFVFRDPRLDRAWTYYGVVETGVYTGIALRNSRTY